MDNILELALLNRHLQIRPSAHLHILFCRSYQYISEFNRTMISLHHNRTGLTFLTVERTTCDARNFLIVNYCFAIYCQGYESSNQRNIVALPFTGIPGKHLMWGNKSVDRSQIVPGGFHSLTVHNLNFITPPKIYAAITSFR